MTATGLSFTRFDGHRLVRTRAGEATRSANRYDNCEWSRRRITFRDVLKPDLVVGASFVNRCSSSPVASAYASATRSTAVATRVHSTARDFTRTAFMVALVQPTSADIAGSALVVAGVLPAAGDFTGPTFVIAAVETPGTHFARSALMVA